MRRAMILVLVGGCSATHATTHDAPRTDPVVCKANLEATLDRTCSVPSDCVLVNSIDCCGTIKLGIKAGTESGFPSAESTYSACLACPPLGCAHQDQAEDGSVPQAGHAIVATCVTSRCKSVVQ
jgi:hypothetical protein